MSSNIDDDPYENLVEMPDGTYRVPPAQPSITHNSNNELYNPPDRKIKKSPKRMQIIIQAFSEGKSVGAACQLADIKPSTLRYWRIQDKNFDQACKDAWVQGTGILEDVAFDRGRNGTEADVYHQGMIVGTKIEHHDTLLLRTLESRAPESWGRATQRMELTGANGGPLKVVTLDLSKSEQELSQLGHSFLIEEYRALLEKSGNKED